MCDLDPKCRCDWTGYMWETAVDEAQTEIARLQAELAEANACHETALNIARAGTEQIDILQAEVERWKELHDQSEGLVAVVRAQRDTRWNDAIEAASELCESKSGTRCDCSEQEYYTALGYELAAEDIRALRKDTK